MYINRFILFFLVLLLATSNAYSLHVTIIESETYNPYHKMDSIWLNVVISMGHSASIAPQSTLNTSSFFPTTDILIISSGIINLPQNRVNTILLFLQSGKPVYLQSEYLATLSGNQAFDTLVTQLGGNFSWGTNFGGTLAPMNVLGTFATTNNNVPPLTYFWHSVSGTGDCNTVNFLEFGGAYHGFQFIPPNSSFGSIITTADQDWINQSNSLDLMENIITHLLSPDSVNVGGPAISLGNDTTICQGESVILNAGSGYLYFWSNGSFDSSIVASSPGTYWVQVMDGVCTSIDSIHIFIQSYPAAELGNDTILCTGNTIDLVCSSAQTYLWSTGSTDSTIMITSPGSYWVQTSNGNCLSSDTINIMYLSPPLPDLGNDTSICSGEMINLLCDTADTYLWSTGNTASSLTVTSSGIYWVQASNGNCIASDTILITVVNPPAINLGNDTSLCQGEIFNLVSNSATSYLWSDGSTDSTLQINSSGIYWVQASIGLCATTDSITIQYLQFPTPNLGNDSTLCQGVNVTLSGGAASAYLWSTGSADSTVTISNSGSYWVQVSNGNCIASDTVNLNFLAYPIPDIGSDTILCQGDLLTLNCAPASSYFWSTGATGPSVSIASSGIYWVQAGNGNCFATDSVNITFIAYPLPDLGNDTILCNGQSISLNAGTAEFYLWDDGTTTPSLTANTSGIYWVESRIGNCSTTDSIEINFVECETAIEFPNVFTPNDDGINDLFVPVKYKGISSSEILIFNRWGEKIFSSQAPENGWTGIDNGNTFPEGTYLWVVKYQTLTETHGELSGTVLLTY